MLLGHLLGKLKVVGVRGHMGHLALHLEVGAGKMLLWWYHAHGNVLLVRGSDLLLLLLEDLDLLREGELFDCGDASAKG
jgi:hypothetical protein